MEASVNRFQLCLALQFETNTALDKFRAEARHPKPIDLWSSFLLPIDLELRRPVARDDPGDSNPALGNRKSAVFCGVGRELVKRQSDKQSGLGPEHDRRSADLQSAVARPMRRQLGRDELT